MMQPAISSLTFLEQIKVFPRDNAEKFTFMICHSVLTTTKFLFLLFPAPLPLDHQCILYEFLLVFVEIIQCLSCSA